jgi:uncharacterized membrane protein HdeD (DUF308 family)
MAGKKANWIWRLLGGLILIILGILVIAYPDITVEIVIFLFGIFMLIWGIMEAIFGLTAPEAKGHKWWFVFVGVLSIIIGILALLTPYYVLVAGWYLIAAWGIVWGIFEIVAAFAIPKEMDSQVYGGGGKWLAVLVGLIAITLGVLFIIYPESSLTTVVWFAGGLTIVLGILVLIGSFQLKKAPA